MAATVADAGPTSPEGKADDANVDLPKATIKRILKPKLITTDEKKATMQIKDDALIALTESAKVFISYVTSTANDFTKEGKRQTMSVDDVFKALDELDFGDFVGPLKDFIEAHKTAAKEKSVKKKEAKAASTAKKRKASDKDGEDVATDTAGGDQAEAKPKGDEEAADKKAETGEAEAMDTEDAA